MNQSEKPKAMPNASDAVPTEPFLPLAAVLNAIANPTRWRILAELATGEQLMVAELAERTGRSADAISKQMALLRATHIVAVGRNRLYRLQPQFIADNASRLIDFGWCLLRMNTTSISTT